MSFVTCINAPGYLPNEGNVNEFETLDEAYAFFIEEAESRYNDTDDSLSAAREYETLYVRLVKAGNESDPEFQGYADGEFWTIIEGGIS